MAATDPLRAKALACLREGRVNLLRVLPDTHWKPVVVVARVRSSRDQHPYRVWFKNARWSCTCRDGLRKEHCAHVAAVQLVTIGGES